jgi:hypothetical protein
VVTVSIVTPKTREIDPTKLDDVKGLSNIVNSVLNLDLQGNSRRETKRSCVQELFSFLQAGKLKDAPIESLVNLVGDALDTLEEDDARYPQLAKIEEELLEGRVPVRRLEKFAQKYGPDPLEVLDAELRAQAAQLAPEQWKTPIYERLEAAIHDRQAGEELVARQRPMFAEALEEFEADLESEDTPSLVGQRLLLEGVRGWLDVFGKLPSSSPALLSDAERANRLLVVVCQLEDRYPELLD